jgi:hypothetical protein
VEKNGEIRQGLTPPENQTKPGEKQADAAALAGSPVQRLSMLAIKAPCVSGCCCRQGRLGPAIGNKTGLDRIDIK